jgi:ankyrin repeat protein
MCSCCCFQGVECVKVFMECKRIDITSKGKKCYNVLHYAAQNGHLEILKHTIEDGAVNPAELNAHGDTATLLAVEAGKHAHLQLDKLTLEG